jgi:hypothetical protein
MLDLLRGHLGARQEAARGPPKIVPLADRRIMAQNEHCGREILHCLEQELGVDLRRFAVKIALPADAFAGRMDRGRRQGLRALDDVLAVDSFAPTSA